MISARRVPCTRLARPVRTQTLVLLHGLMGHASNWAATVTHFQGRYRVLPLTFDTCGEDQPYHTLESLTEATCEAMDRHGVERAVLFGNSMGGQIALKVALTAPQRVAGLVLAGSAGLLERSLADNPPLNPSRDYVRAKVREVFFDERHVTDERLDEIERMLCGVRNKLRLVKLARSLRACNLHAHLPEVAAPTLLVWGQQDTITPIDTAQVFAERLPNARLRVLDQCGHSPNIEWPDKFNRLAEEFLIEIGYT